MLSWFLLYTAFKNKGQHCTAGPKHAQIQFLEDNGVYIQNTLRLLKIDLWLRVLLDLILNFTPAYDHTQWSTELTWTCSF